MVAKKWVTSNARTFNNIYDVIKFIEKNKISSYYEIDKYDENIYGISKEDVDDDKNGITNIYTDETHLFVYALSGDKWNLYINSKVNFNEQTKIYNALYKNMFLNKKVYVFLLNNVLLNTLKNLDDTVYKRIISMTRYLNLLSISDEKIKIYEEIFTYVG